MYRKFIDSQLEKKVYNYQEKTKKYQGLGYFMVFKEWAGLKVGIEVIHRSQLTLKKAKKLILQIFHHQFSKRNERTKISTRILQCNYKIINTVFKSDQYLKRYTKLKKDYQNTDREEEKTNFFQWILSSFCPTKNISQSSVPAAQRLTAKINGFNTQDNKIQSSQSLVQRFKQERGHYL